MKDYPLATNTLGDEEREAILRVFDSGRITAGQEVAAFEREFAHHVGSRHAVMVNSGSSANLLMIATLVEEGRLKAGDEVIVPAVSWATSYYPLHQYGLKIVLCDVDPYTFNLTRAHVEECITKHTRAVLAVNLLGNPCNYDHLQMLCATKGLILLEDNCEGFDARWGTKHCGTFGEMGTFSSYFSHHLNTMEGGMIVTDNVYQAQLMRSLRSHGWMRGWPNCDPKGFEFNYIGYNVRPMEMAAAIGRVQLRHYVRAGVSGRRAANALRFQTLFGQDPRWYPQRPEGSQPSWFGLGLVLSPDMNLELARETLNVAGIETRPIIAGNFARQPVAKKMNITHGPLPGADLLHDHGLMLGNDERDLRGWIDTAFGLLREVAA